MSLIQRFRRKLLLPLQLFLAIFGLGVWITVPKIERDLTLRTNDILREMGIEDKVRVKFNGPVATLTGKVPAVALRTKLVERIESMESLWGLRVANPNSIQIIAPMLPITYRLDFASREIRLTGNLPGELEKRALLGKAKRLFPGSGVMDQTVIPTGEAMIEPSSRNNNGVPMRMSLNLLENLPNIATIGQLRWVTVEEGALTVSANLPNEAAKAVLEEAVQKIDTRAKTADLKVIATPTIELAFATHQQITATGTLGATADEAIAADYFKNLFPKAKIETQFKIDETLGPVDWILPKFQNLPRFFGMGKLTRFVASGDIPILEAETINVSAQISMNMAVEEAYKKQIKSTVSVATHVTTTITPPSLWATIGEETTEVTGAASDEAGKTLLMEKLAALFPSIKFNAKFNIVSTIAPTRLYLPALDPIVDISTIEPTFILQGFGLVDGRLKFTGLVPDNATKERLTGIVLKRHLGRVTAEITVDPAYLPSPEANWTCTFANGKLTLTGQVSSKQLKASILADLEQVYPNAQFENNLEVIPSGLRKGEWDSLLNGLPVVAAKEQTGVVSWKKNRLALNARVPSEESKQAMLLRLRRTYGKRIDAQIDIVDDPALAANPAVSLMDCTIYFEPSQKDFVNAEMSKIQRVFDILQAYPELKISIEGSTDDKGSLNGNINTSLLRADTVRKWLNRRGVAIDRMAVKGHGPKRPVADFKTDEGRAANRRLDFRVQ